MAMLGDFRQGHAAAKAGDVGVFRNLSTHIQRHPAPIGHCLRNAFDVAVEQFDLHPTDIGTELARVDKQHFARTSNFLFGEEPQAGRDLRIEEQLARQRDHHFHHIRFDQHDFFMRNDKAVYDFEDNFQDNFQDNFEGETLANPL